MAFNYFHQANYILTNEHSFLTLIHLIYRQKFNSPFTRFTRNKNNLWQILLEKSSCDHLIAAGHQLLSCLDGMFNWFIKPMIRKPEAGAS